MFERPKSKKMEILGKIMDEMKARMDESRMDEIWERHTIKNK